MKPFNLEDAKAGKAVCTRTGNKVRILDYNLNGEYPLAVAILSKYSSDAVITATNNGCVRIGEPSDLDLFMDNAIGEGWVNPNYITDVEFEGSIKITFEL